MEGYDLRACLGFWPTEIKLHGEHVPGVETRIDDALGTQGLKQDIVFMPYSRKLGGENGDQIRGFNPESVELVGEVIHRGVGFDHAAQVFDLVRLELNPLDKAKYPPPSKQDK